MPQLAVQTVSLGNGNEGAIGPDDMTAEEIQAVHQANALPEYARKASKRWVCVDGRLFQQEETATITESNEADPQIAGGITVSEAAAEYQLNRSAQKLSDTLTQKTQAALRENLEVTVHGDEENDEEGCGALKKLRDALRYNARHADSVLPLAWAINEKLGLNELLVEKDLVKAIETGAINADNETLWDVDTKKASQIIVQSGGTYIICKGKHTEKDIRVDLTDSAFVKAKFVQDMQTRFGKLIEQFSVSFGAYKTEAFRRAALHNKTEHDAALQVMAVVLFNLGVCKILSNENMQADIVSVLQ